MLPITLKVYYNLDLPIVKHNSTQVPDWDPIVVVTIYVG